ncbi:MAG TPA: hypothetical protein VHT51_00925 [Micropepsaceae bacterium]|jgi:hypothetical protein|nr:hypothetical protein [Micropepsaceae bacterium]
MSDPSPLPPIPVEYKIDVQSLWAKYEDIAMHFNDLLMRLRTQALAGIAAFSTLVGILTKENNGDFSTAWLVASFIFLALALFWIAIWCLDLLYYNRMLMGAVAALLDLEKKSKSANVDGIAMSTHIAQGFGTRIRYVSIGGVVAFYTIVLFAILCGVVFSWYMHGIAPDDIDTTSA